MEEFRKIRKQHQLPQQIKLKRKIFYNRRFHTLPNDNRNSNTLQNSIKIHYNSTNRQSCIQRINIRNIDFDEVIKHTKKSKTKNLLQKNKKCNTKNTECIPLILIKKDTKEEKSTKSRRLNMNSTRTCRNICTGYAKRTERTKQNHQKIRQLFRDSTNIDTNKQKLFSNVNIMSKALRNSFPKNFLIYQQNDQSLKLKNEQFSSLFKGKMININSVR